MSPPFKSFLQGLLCKDCNKRLSWPHLAQHEFVKDGIKCKLKAHLFAVLMLFYLIKLAKAIKSYSKNTYSGRLLVELTKS